MHNYVSISLLVMYSVKNNALLFNPIQRLHSEACFTCTGTAITPKKVIIFTLIPNTLIYFYVDGKVSPQFKTSTFCYWE